MRVRVSQRACSSGYWLMPLARRPPRGASHAGAQRPLAHGGGGLPGALRRSRRVTAEDILDVLQKDDLKSLCGGLGRELSAPSLSTAASMKSRAVCWPTSEWVEDDRWMKRQPTDVVAKAPQPVTRTEPQGWRPAMDHVGIDMRKKESQVCILEEDGSIIEKRIRTLRERFAEVFGGRPRRGFWWSLQPRVNG